MTTYNSMPGIPRVSTLPSSRISSAPSTPSTWSSASQPLPKEKGGLDPDHIPLTSLPPLPERSLIYYTQPLAGIAVVALASGTCMKATHDFPVGSGETPWQFTLVCFFSGVAFFCLYVLLRDETSDEIRRSKATCYPIPPDVASRLRSPDYPTLLPMPSKNIQGPSGSTTLYSYCVRCYVWRPPPRFSESLSHHCSVCQRCYTGFDHHCGIIGRCIVRSNLIWFYLLIAMLPCGLVVSAVPASSPPWMWYSALRHGNQTNREFPFKPPHIPLPDDSTPAFDSATTLFQNTLETAS